MPTINDTFINALLADASYVNGLMVGDSLSDLKAKLSDRMTPVLAKLISDNFTVVSAINTPDGATEGSGFDAVVWRGNAGTPYAGQQFVSMRGTEGISDFLNDASLATSGNARSQLVDMVNWWLRETAPAGQAVRQIKTVKSILLDGVWEFEVGSSSTGTGAISASDLAGGMQVNGHSLGGYLASVFTRLFGTQAHVTQTTTFNSAGLAPGSEAAFSDIQSVVGAALGRAEFPAGDDDSQLNYFAKHGLNLTTNSFWFNQVGKRVELFNEESGSQIPNHFMYKLTDALALTKLMSRLDPTTTIARANAMFESGSTSVVGEIEGVLDALRRILQNTDAVFTPAGDVSSSAASRLAFYSNLDSLQASSVFLSLVGKIRIDASSIDIQAKARNDFSALASLITLSPVVLTGLDSALDTALQSVWGSTYTNWQADRSLSQAEREAGKGSFTENWIKDRSQLLASIVLQNQGNTTTGVVLNPSAPADRAYEFRYYGGAPRQGEIQSPLQILISESRQGGVKPSQLIAFGDNSNNLLEGTDYKLEDHLYGGGGDDTLKGKAGADYLEGNAGNDNLDGGADSDTLVGGEGDDTYQFTGTFGSDTVIDAGGQGVIKVDGNVLAGGNSVSKNLWLSADKKYRYAKVATGEGKSNLIITREGSSANTITIRNYEAGNLGITLEGYANDGVAVVPDSGEKAVFAGVANNYVDAQGHAAADPYGRINFSVYDQSDAAMRLQRAGEYIQAGGGFVAANGAPGVVKGGHLDDVIEGGDGTDLILGGGGADVIHGGGGFDFISVGSGGHGYTSEEGALGFFNGDYEGNPILHLYSHAEAVRAGINTEFFEGLSVFTNGYFGPLLSYENELLKSLFIEGSTVDGGTGADAIYGGIGDDTLYGGDGVFGDHIYGGYGDDFINGGEGDDRLWGDGRFFDNTDGTKHGEDLILGGAGNDYITGDGNDDVIEAGEGDDIVYGDMDVADYRVYQDLYGQRISSAQQGEDYVDGGNGNDQIFGGAKADELIGGDGDDIIYGDFYWSDQTDLGPDAEGADFLSGGSGSDFLVGGGKDDFLEGGDGADYLFGDDITVEVSSYTIAGTAHDKDYLDGGNGDDHLVGGGNDDILIGGSGKDILWGDGDGLAAEYQGDDFLEGGEGDDELYGNGGDDVLLGGAGADLLVGGDGDDTLDGEEGHNVLSGGAGDDVYFAHAGDAIVDAEGQNTIKLGVTRDKVKASITGNGLTLNLGAAEGEGIYIDDYARVGKTRVVFSDGTQTTLAQLAVKTISEPVNFFSYDGNTVVYGGLRGDALYASGRGSTLMGGAGNDDVYAAGLEQTVQYSRGDGVDTLSGGNNSKLVIALDGDFNPQDLRLEVDNQGQVFVRFGAGEEDRMKLGLYGDALKQSNLIDHFTFTDGSVLSFADLLARSVKVIGTAEDDFLAGTNANDEIFGGAGSNTLSGGEGADTYVIAAGSANTVDDSEGNNVIRLSNATSWTDVVLSRPVENGNDLLLAIGGDTAVTLSSALLRADKYSVELANGQVRTLADLISGLSSVLVTGDYTDDFIQGTAQTDVLNGGAGNDTLQAGAGADLISGGDGNDILVGGAGDDILFGGAGDDVFMVGAADGMDQVLDYEGANTVRFAAGIIPSQLTVERLGDSTDVRISVDGGNSVLVMRAMEGAVARYEFADGTAWTYADLINQFVSPGWQVIAGDDLNNAVEGTSGDDLLLGNRGDDVLHGHAGDDELLAGDGADRLVGGAGNDSLDGGEGADIFEFSLGDGEDRLIDLAGASSIKFGAGINLQSLTATHVMLEGEGYLRLTYSGSDSVLIKDGVALTGSAFVFADGTSMTSTQVYSSASTDARITPEYGEGDDLILGYAGNDTLQGGGGEDRLEGQGGNDLLDGSAGHDVLVGGTGNDTYVMGQGGGGDTLIEDLGQSSVVSLGAGDETTLSYARSGNSLLVSSSLLDASVFIANFYSGPSTWTLRTESGAELDLRSLAIAGVAERTTDQRRDDFYTKLISQAPAFDMGEGIFFSSTGTREFSADGNDYVYSFRRDRALLESDDATIEASSYDWTRSQDSVFLGTSTRTLTWQETVVDYSTVTRTQVAAGRDILLGYFGTENSTGAGAGWVAAGFVVPAGWNSYTDAHNGFHIYEPPKFLTTVTPHFITYEVTQTYTDYHFRYTHEASTVVEDVRAGDQDNSIILTGSAPKLVSGGGGNDVITRIDFIRNDVFDASLIHPADWVDGGAGDDTVKLGAGDDEISGGSGNDYLDGGAGDDTYIVSMDDDGWDTIYDSAAASVRVNLRSFLYGQLDAELVNELRSLMVGAVSSATLGGPLGLVSGEVLLTAENLNHLMAIDRARPAFDAAPMSPSQRIRSALQSTGLDQVIADATGAPFQSYQYSGGATELLRPELLFTEQNLAATLQSLTDAVRFGAGISVQDLQISWGLLELDEGTRDVMLVSWGGQGGVKIVAPDAGIPGVGIEVFEFADGTRMTMAQMLALAPPRPVVSNAIEAGSALGIVQVAEDTELSFAMPADAFILIGNRTPRFTAALAGSGDPLPDWLSIDSRTGLITGTPHNENVGNLTIEVTAYQSGQLHASQTFTLQVNNVNDAPVALEYASIDPETASSGAPFSWTLPGGLFNDSDAHDRLSLRVESADGSALPSWLRLNAATGKLEGMPTDADVGEVMLRLVAVDLAGAKAFVPFSIQVAPFDDGIEEIDGTAGNDTLWGTSASDLFDGQTGDDTLFGDTGNDVYLYSRGDGSDYIEDYDETVGNVDTLRFYDGTVTAADIKVTRSVNELYLNIVGTSDRITLGSWFIGGDVSTIEQVEFYDGTVWNAAMLESLVVMGEASEGSDELVGTTGDDTISGLGGEDELFGMGGIDTLDGGAGADHLSGGAGSDVYLFGRGSGEDVINDFGEAEGDIDTLRFDSSVEVADVIVSRDAVGTLFLGINGTDDKVQVNNWFSDTPLLAEQVERVEFHDGTVWTSQTLSAMATFLGTPGQDYLPGSQDNDMLRGLDGDDTLFGGDGSDALEGGAGNDYLMDFAGSSNYFNGGDGDDEMLGGTGAKFFIGGAGNDSITSESGPDVIAFNVGDGQDILYVNGSTQSPDDTVSLGGAGLDYANLSLEKNGSDLVLKVSQSDQLTFSGWYDGTANQTVLNLQLVAEAMTAFDAGSSDPLLNKKIQTFDFQALVGAFDAARTATPGLSSWALSNGLTQFHLAGSDSEALGGDLAYHYGADGTLAGIGLGKAQDVLTNAQFGAQVQGIHSSASLQDGLIRLG